MNERPHLTLAQFLKVQGLAETGGQAKHRVREGGITVDGVAEDRPGRKLFGGEVVVVDGEEYRVEAEA
jgi:ribosome-associated protein